MWACQDRYSVPWRGTDLFWIVYATEDMRDVAETLSTAMLESGNCQLGLLL